MIMGAYCVGKVHNMLPQLHYDNGSCTICCLSSIMIFEAYCVGKAHNMLP